ncbi:MULTISPECIES: hypothetical protein [Moorena]|uniref:hypothetical protein n=1 Tax=Moorena TaxID=1155738 RepID=UPI0011812ECF|nr:MULTISPECIES: hypothetical protein [Moorena]NEO13294.1 hypothetical protein [Moorena sp. SIO3E8]NEO23974.1 hypothetical protein [Moorena sp. SIO4A5]NEQ02456.1 hypothetical protein [Moorena sp. SIO3F7]NEQ62968.1 hypothetical protein [Moorena sp. SIO4A1]
MPVLHKMPVPRKMPIPPRCPLYKTITIILLLSNAWNRGALPDHGIDHRSRYGMLLCSRYAMLLWSRYANAFTVPSH